MSIMNINTAATNFASVVEQKRPFSGTDDLRTATQDLLESAQEALKPTYLSPVAAISVFRSILNITRDHFLGVVNRVFNLDKLTEKLKSDEWKIADLADAGCRRAGDFAPYLIKGSESITNESGPITVMAKTYFMKDGFHPREEFNVELGSLTIPTSKHGNQETLDLNSESIASSELNRTLKQKLHQYVTRT